MKHICNGIFVILLAASFAVCTYAQEKPWTKPLLISSQKVDAAFKHALPIPDLTRGMSGNAKYRVRASRHDAPTDVEIHVLDTNIFYVTAGEATMVVGGKAIGAHKLSDFEWRAKSIEGGTTYHLKKGDIMIVPRDTPQWFQKIPSAPFLFILVKVQ